MSKLMKASMNYYQAGVCYNICILISDYFRYRIINLYKKEEEELRRIYEELLLRKLGLSIKFLRIIMHESKDSLGLGMIKPKIIVASYVMKIYLGNKKHKLEVAKLIKALEEHSWVNQRLNEDLVNNEIEVY